MKPPVSRNPLLVRDRILDAAQAEFMAAGYAGASTNRILQHFGGSKPTMFRHFPTKRALFEAVVARIAGRWETAINWQAIAADEPRAWLEQFGTMALRWILAEDNLFVGRMGVSEAAGFPEIGETYRRLAVEPIEAVLAERFAAWSEAGLLQCPDVRRDATAFLDLTLSGAVSRRLYGVEELRGDALDAHVAYAVGIFLQGRLRPPASS